MTQLVIGAKVREMFGEIAPQYDTANAVLSFGIHHLWRRRFFKCLPEPRKLRALDLCTGTGDLLPKLAERYGEALGIDFCYPMLAAGKRKWFSNQRISALQGDALSLPIHDRSIDLITVAYGVRNLESLDKGLAEMRRVLAPGGRLFVLEFGQPIGLVWRALFTIYSRYLMPLIGGMVTGNRSAYTYLPETSRRFPCRDSFLSILSTAGFRRCSYRPLSGGIAYIYEAEV